MKACRIEEIQLHSFLISDESLLPPTALPSGEKPQGGWKYGWMFCRRENDVPPAIN